MKQKSFRLATLVLALLLMVSMFAPSALAANYTTDYTQYSTPSSTSDYAYWNGWRVVRAPGTTTSEVMWIQASLNWCIANGKISADMIPVDGSFGPASAEVTGVFQVTYGLTPDKSFGPASITKMKEVLSQGSTMKYQLVWPTASTTITGKYGPHGSFRSSGTRYHSGIDIGSRIGDPCYAVADGVVIMCRSTDDAKSTVGGRGRYIVLYHGNGNFSSLYEHLDACYVKVGDTVKAGQKIGTTGNSGWVSYGVHYDAHLHLGLIYGKMPDMGYDLWTVPGRTYNGRVYENHTFEPDPRYNKNIRYTYK